MKLSAVVQLIDGFSQAPAVGIEPRFLLDGKPCHPYAKPQAFFAFTELAEGKHRLTAIAPPFFPQDVALDVPLALPLADAIVPCRLDPGPLYPYPAGTTIVRGLVRATATNESVAGVGVEASYDNWRGEKRHAVTRTSDYGRYDGRYALALVGRLAPETDVTLTFSKTGYAGATAQIRVTTATTQFVDIEIR